MAAASEQSSRFANISDTDLQEILENKDAKNTKRATSTAVKLFREYLTEKNISADFESFSTEELDSRLGRFYAEARNKSGELYKKSSLTTIRYGLSRYICSKNNCDITKDINFEKSQKIFKAVSKDLKRQGKGGSQHYPPVDDKDLMKAYAGFDLYDARSLQQTVFMDLMLYFGRRGRENLRDLKICDFALTTDASGLRYIYLKKDELTKNHQEEANTADGHMFEIRDDDRCPVRTFLRYKSKLNKDCGYFFQRPSKCAKEHCWYDAVPVGHNFLGNMMTKISKEYGLSQIYTNHSLRATTVHVLDVAKFPDRHIMSVTGHKAQTSLKTYTGYTDSKTKQKMSETLSGVLRAKKTTFTCTSTSNSTSIASRRIADAYVAPLTSNTYPELNSEACFELLPLTDSQEDRLITDMKDDTNFDEILSTLNIPLHGPCTSATEKENRVLPANNTLNLSTNMNMSNLSYAALPTIYNYGSININYNIVPK